MFPWVDYARGLLRIVMIILLVLEEYDYHEDSVG
jgi:hypothetical protein